MAKFVLSEHKDVVKTAAGKVDVKAPPYNGAYRVTDQHFFVCFNNILMFHKHKLFLNVALAVFIVYVTLL